MFFSHRLYPHSTSHNSTRWVILSFPAQKRFCLTRYLLKALESWNVRCERQQPVIKHLPRIQQSVYLRIWRLSKSASRWGDLIWVQIKISATLSIGFANLCWQNNGHLALTVRCFLLAWIISMHEWPLSESGTLRYVETLTEPSAVNSYNSHAGTTCHHLKVKSQGEMSLAGNK